MAKKKAAVVGATGLAGQQFLATLANHPLIEVTKLAGSQRSAGKEYRKAILDDNGSTQWYCSEALSEKHASLVVEDSSRLDASEVDVVFSAVESDVAKELEPKYARTTPVISTASAFRYESDVPVFVPGVNMDHETLLDRQMKTRGWKGYVTPIPNCTTTGLVVTLKPLLDAFGIKSVLMTSMQACSGAGRNPGVRALDIDDNVIPFIPKEEEKVERETRKILGKASDGVIIDAGFRVSATCTRVPVLEGHTEAVYVSLEKKASVEEVKIVFNEFGKELSGLNLPSAPRHFIHVHEDPFRPQPRRDRELEGGMATSVGRIREDSVLENGVKYVLLSHNTKMGAAKGAVLVAEYLMSKKRL